MHGMVWTNFGSKRVPWSKKGQKTALRSTAIVPWFLKSHTLSIECLMTSFMGTPQTIKLSLSMFLFTLIIISKNASQIKICGSICGPFLGCKVWWYKLIKLRDELFHVLCISNLTPTAHSEAFCPIHHDFKGFKMFHPMKIKIIFSSYFHCICRFTRGRGDAKFNSSELA